MINTIMPNWPASNKIKAYTTTRIGGVSQAPYDSLNLGNHVGDNSENVKQNRTLLAEFLQMPVEPVWLNQVHGTNVVQADEVKHIETADAAYTNKKNIICTVLTADCLPILICDQDATCVAAIHAGWRGLAAGVIEATLEKIAIPSEKLFVWLGPAIGPNAFEVGDEVREEFIAHDPQATLAFKRNENNRWLADIYLLARQRLSHYQVNAIYGGDFCTYSDKEFFYSYRRDRETGRMASLIWIED